MKQKLRLELFLVGATEIKLKRQYCMCKRESVISDVASHHT